MKKRLLAYVAALALTVSLCGCGGEAGKPSLIKDNTSVSSTSVSDSTGVSGDTVSASTDVTDIGEITGEKMVLYTGGLYKAVYLDESGKVEKIKDIDYDGASFIDIFGNYGLYLKYEYNAATSTSKNIVIAVDMNSGAEKIICESSGSLKTDFYEGVIYISSYDYQSGKTTEVAFDAATLEETDSYQDFYKALDGYKLIGCDYGEKKYNSYKCAKRLMDEMGFVLVQEKFSYGGEGLFKYDGKAFTAVEAPENISDIVGYDAEHIFVSIYDNDSFTYSLLTDNYTNNYFSLCNDMYRFLAYIDGRAYWATSDSHLYGVEMYTLNVFDTAVGKVEEKLSLQKHPGISLPPIVSGFYVSGDSVYYLADDEIETAWYRTDISALGANSVKIPGSTVATYDWSNLGTIEYVNEVIDCPLCGKRVCSFYMEFFCLDDRFSPKAGLINDSMFKRAGDAKTANSDGIYGYGYLDDNGQACEGHGTYMQIEESVSVTRVEIVADKYLQVCTSGYWYGGGAHGMPSQQVLIYDLATGDSLDFLDIYPGSDEELKNIIIEACVRTARESIESGENYGFYSDDLDAIRSDAESNTYVENGSIYMGTTGITYSYEPYLMGPYAAGFIDIFVSYDDLGFNPYK